MVQWNQLADSKNNWLLKAKIEIAVDEEKDSTNTLGEKLHP